MTISTNYHGINKDELSRIVSTSSPDLSNVPESERVYLGKTLSTHEFYKGRMMTDGNETAESVFNSKYLGPAETGPLNTWYRLSTAMSSVEKTPEQQEERFYEFMDALDDFKLVPGGRIMHGGGREDIKTTLNNCYVVAIPGDSINSIYQAIQDEATTFKKGGGCGTNLSILRPEDAGIKGTGGVSCGPTGFMELYSTNTNTIAQHGRRGALMLNISSWHPDVEKFATIKNDIEGPKAQLEALVEKYPWEKDVLKGLREDLESRRGIRYANISVLLGHDFISAVENDTDFDLRFPDVDAYGSVPEMKEFYNRVWDGDISRWEESFKGAQAKGEIPEDMLALKTYKTIKAKSLWDTIIHNAHTSAEPGILFWDTMRDFHNLEYCSPLSSTNPCGEQPLPDGGCCNLAAVNLERMVNDDGTLNVSLFQDTVRTGVRFLDNVIDYNLDRHALESQKENASKDRRIGLGITGLADMLIKMGIKYDSQEGLEKVEEVMALKLRAEYEESISLAEQKGSFENYNWDGLSKSKFIQNLPEDIQEKIKTTGLRNGTVNTCAPVGSGAIVAEGSSGVEPIFSKSYERDVRKHEENIVETHTVFHPLIENLYGKDGNVPSHVTVAHEIDPMFRVKMQGVIQKYTDTSISSTINLPRDVPESVVGDIYKAAYHEGLKGVTVYVEGSRGGVLRTKGLEDGLDEDITDYQAFSKLVQERINRERPEFIEGATEKVDTPHGTKALVNLSYNMSGDGHIIAPYECVANMGKAGQDISAFAEALGRSISLNLKAGVPVEMITGQLRGIGGETQIGFGEAKVRSLPDAIGKGLDDGDRKKRRFENKDNDDGNDENQSENKKSGKIYSGRICDASGCGSTKVIEENGCFLCESCGDSKCG